MSLEQHLGAEKGKKNVYSKGRGGGGKEPLIAGVELMGQWGGGVVTSSR